MVRGSFPCLQNPGETPREAEDGEWQDLLVDEAVVDQETRFGEPPSLAARENRGVQPLGLGFLGRAP